MNTACNHGLKGAAGLLWRYGNIWLKSLWQGRLHGQRVAIGVWRASTKHVMVSRMDGLRTLNHRLTALMVATVLVLSSTLLPTLSFAQKYADHLANYGGQDSRLGALTAFSELYVDPQAALLPVVLSADAPAPGACLPPSGLVEKLVFTRAPQALAPELGRADLFGSERHPTGLDPATVSGPPRPCA